MKKYISYEKLSKKEQKKINSQKRGDWGLTNPVTRVVESKKKYSRKEKHKGSGHDDNWWTRPICMNGEKICLIF